MLDVLPALGLLGASVILSVRTSMSWVRGRRVVRNGIPGRSVLVVVAVPRGGEPGRAMARSLAATAYAGPMALRIGCQTGEVSGARLAEEALRVAPGLDVSAISVTPSSREVSMPRFAIEAALDHDSDVVALVDVATRPTARDLARLLSCPMDSGPRWVAAVPVKGTGGTFIGGVWSGVATDMAPMTAAACGAAGLPALLSAGTRSAWDAIGQDSLALHRPTLAHSAALCSDRQAVLVPVPSALHPGCERLWTRDSLRVLWRACPLGMLWVLAALLALPVAICTMMSSGTHVRLTASVVLAAWVSRMLTALTWGRSTCGVGSAVIATLLAPFRDIVSSSAFIASAFLSKMYVGGDEFRVRRGGVLVPVAKVPRFDE